MAWSPDSKHVAFVQKESAGLHLWVVDVAKNAAHRVGAVKLNAVLGDPCEWLADSHALLCKIVPAARGAAPESSAVPAGPNVAENLGKVTPARTYEDLLKTPADEAIFAFYATSELAVVSLDGSSRTLPVKGLISEAQPSPTGALPWLKPCIGPSAMHYPWRIFPPRCPWSR